MRQRVMSFGGGMASLAIVLFLAAFPRSSAAQEVPGTLPETVAHEAVAFANAETTLRLTGRTRVPAGSSIRGDVAVLGGPVFLDGTVEGDLWVLNGDLQIGERGRVSGAIVVIGGTVTGAGARSNASRTTRYLPSLPYTLDEGRLGLAGGREEDADGVSGLRFGNVRFTARAGTNYNRVEGLPILFGPIVETGGANLFRIDAFALYRTGSGLRLDSDEIGYWIRGLQTLGGRRFGISIGATLHDQTDPIESWGVSDLEASLATFLLHEDLRDYHRRKGWSAFLRFERPGIPLSATVELRDDEHSTPVVGGPWSLTDNDEPWRPLALVAEGDFRSVALRLEWDGRNDPVDPSDGWWFRGEMRKGVGGDWTLPGYTTPYLSPLLDADRSELQTEVPATPFETDVTVGFGDLRRYLRVSPGVTLSLRGVAGGGFGDTPIVPQLQHAFGGEGMLPGYGLFEHDCGARDLRVARPAVDGEGLATSEPYFPAYGCHRFAVAQVELIGRLPFSIRMPDWGSEGSDWLPPIDLTPAWTLFFDAGQGWGAPGGAAGPGIASGDTGWRKDLGGGIRIGDLSLLYAHPLDGDGPGNFFIRLTRRF